MAKKNSISQWTSVTFQDVHIGSKELNDYINSLLDNRGLFGRYAGPTGTVITVDFPLDEKNRTKRFYVHLTDNDVTVRYHPERRRRLDPYHEAIDKLVDMLKEGKSKLMRAEGASYDNSQPPLVIGMTSPK